jgi:hypothetical protein
MARSWVALYTRGLADEVREARRSEVESDLWEQQWFAARRGDPALATAIEILARMLFGILADLAWRVETRSSLKTVRRTGTMNDSLFMRITFLVVSLPLLAILLNGLGMLLGGGEFDSRGEQIIYGFGLVALPLVAITGVWLSRARPLLGVILAITGVAGICIALFWMAPITVPIGIAIVAFSAVRGGLIRLPASRPRAA